MSASNSINKAEIERKIDENPDLTDAEKAAAKAKIFEMVKVVEKAQMGSEARKEMIKKSWQMICVSSITSNNIDNALEHYLKLEDDGTRLRDIINSAYQQFNFLTPIDNMLNFINVLPSTHLKMSGIYALLAAMREKGHADNVKMLRVQEYVEVTIMPQLSEVELKSNNLYQKLPSKVAKHVEDAIKSCVTKVLEEKYGEIMFYARECPGNFEKQLPNIVNASYSPDNFEKLLDFVLTLPSDALKMTGLNEIIKLAKERTDLGPDAIELIHKKIKALENPAFDPFLTEVNEITDQITKL